jgi:hypothetical protein
VQEQEQEQKIKERGLAREGYHSREITTVSSNGRNKNREKQFSFEIVSWQATKQSAGAYRGFCQRYWHRSSLFLSTGNLLDSSKSQHVVVSVFQVQISEGAHAGGI